ncbi:MAG: glycosyltransferase [Candidatus Limnocylindria bacterium]
MAPRAPRRILMISTHGYVSAQPELGRPDTGGQVVYVLELSASLARLGYRVDIMTRRFEDQPAIEQVAEHVRIVRVPAGGPDLIRKEWLCDAIPEWIVNAERYIRAKSLQYRFIDSHYWDAGLAGDGLAARLGIPHLHTPHSLGTWKRDNMDGDPATLDGEYNFTRRIHDERAVYASADALIATTPQQRDLLREPEYDVPAEKIAMIPPGFDDARFFPVSAATRTALKRDLGVDGPLILALGRVAANKGWDLLITSLPTVLSRVPGATLLLAVGSTDPTPGEMQQVEALRRLAAELGVADHIRFDDHIADEALADTYRAADVFALSSRYEPFGMTAVEAMACGTPTVITTEGGLWEMVTWGLEALYANPLDPEAFGQALATVLLYPRVAEQLSRFGSQRARSTFTWNGIAQQLLSVEHVAERPAPVVAPGDRRGPRAAITVGDRMARELEWARSGSS